MNTVIDILFAVFVTGAIIRMVNVIAKFKRVLKEADGNASQISYSVSFGNMIFVDERLEKIHGFIHFVINILIIVIFVMSR